VGNRPRTSPRWPTGAFLAAYQHNRDAAHEIAIESSPIGSYIPLLLADGDFEGTPAELLNTLTGCASRAAFHDRIAGTAGVDPTKGRGWPRTRATVRNAPATRA